MKKISKQKAIELILTEIENGRIDRGKCLAKIGKGWQIPVRSFDRYWKEANTIYQKQQQSILKQVEEDNVKLEKERLKRQILSKHERMEIASKIAKGEAWKVQSELIIPSAGDRMRALDYLSKIDGDYAPKQLDHTTKGEKINGSVPNLSKLSIEELETLEELSKKIDNSVPE